MFNLFVVHSRCWAGHRLVEPVTKKKRWNICNENIHKYFKHLLQRYCVLFIFYYICQTSLSSNLIWFYCKYFVLSFMIFFVTFSPGFLRHRKIIFSTIFSIITFRDLQTNLDLDSKTIPTTKLSIGVFSVREYWKFIDHAGGENDIASSKKKKKKCSNMKVSFDELPQENWHSP